jgi:hypothetical protein
MASYPKPSVFMQLAELTGGCVVGSCHVGTQWAELRKRYPLASGSSGMHKHTKSVTESASELLGNNKQHTLPRPRTVKDQHECIAEGTRWVSECKGREGYRLRRVLHSPESTCPHEPRIVRLAAGDYEISLPTDGGDIRHALRANLRFAGSPAIWLLAKVL